jgi:orotidine-5'-phosphate decarboxylase
MTKSASRTLSYGDRLPLHTNKCARDLLEIMDRKKTNLCVSVDVTTKAELLRIVKAVGPSVCSVKVSSIGRQSLPRREGRGTRRKRASES